MALETRKRIALLFVAATATILLFSCGAKSTSIEERISDFVTSLNGNRSDTHTNLDPSTAAYSTADATFWNNSIFGPSTNGPFTYAPNPPNTTTPSDVEITISDNIGPVGLFKFVMVNIGSSSDNWVINDIQRIPGGTLF